MTPGDAATSVTTTRERRWWRSDGSYRGRPFNAVLRTKRPVEGMQRLLAQRHVHRSTALEDAVLALAALGSPEQQGLRCSYLTNGAHVHEYPGPQGAPTVVLLHALAGNLHNWIPVVDLLRGQVRVVLLDLPGHGLSASRLPGPPPRLAQQCVDWLDGALDELDVDSFHLVGHSLGGRVAAYYASLGERSLQSLTLVAPALRPSLTGLRGLATRAASLMALVRGHTGARLVAGFVFFDMLVHHSESNRRLVGYALQDMLNDQQEQGFTGVRAALSWLRSAPDDRDIDWPAVVARHPVHALFGAQDAYCPLRTHPGLQGAGVDVDELEGTGHLLPLEAPQAVVDSLRRHALPAGGATGT